MIHQIWHALLQPAGPMAGYDKSFLTSVQGTFSQAEAGFGTQQLVVIIVLAFIVAGLYILARLFKLDRPAGLASEINRIENPRQIMNIVRRSIDLRAVYDIEVYDRAYGETYKCMPIGLNEQGQIEAELGSYLDINLDFKNKRVRVAFRMARRSKQEFYQFETTSLFMGPTSIRGLREKSIRLAMPARVTRGQKRRFVRVSPAGRFSLAAVVLASSRPGRIQPLKDLKRLDEAEVLDISIGGLRAVTSSPKQIKALSELDELYLYFKLPLEDLPLPADIPREYFVKVQKMAYELNATGRYELRVQFKERGALDAKTKAVMFRPATWLSFEDLFGWIQAYQRLMIQEERGTKARPQERRGLYEPQPLNVKPKYPRQQLRRTQDDDSLEVKE